MTNLHKYYYQDYFTDINFNYLMSNNPKAPDGDVAKIKQRNNLMTDKSHSLNRNGEWVLREEYLIPNIVSPDNDENRFQFDIQYPGLVTGIGINHEAKIEGEFKLGVHFDWTYGMPVIYGSSVKGVLRSWFMEFYKTSKNKYYECGIDADDLLRDIFSGEVRDIKTEKEKYKDNWAETVKNVKKRVYKGKSIYDRDIFFDAVIVQPDTKGRILCSDSITPHGDNPLKNPTPITFLKIAPGCTIQFRFKLVPTKIKSTDGTELTFSETNKIAIFKEILTTVGIGAKTNVGYGQLDSQKSNKNEESSQSKKIICKAKYITTIGQQILVRIIDLKNDTKTYVLEFLQDTDRKSYNRKEKIINVQVILSNNKVEKVCFLPDKQQ